MANRVENGATRDGRTLRWARHNEERRAELLEATFQAIRQYGHGAGLETIARVAGTRKPALYRHFGDRVGLYSAVATTVATNIETRLGTAVAEGGTLRHVIGSLIEAYLALAERDPEVYRFVVSPPQVAGAVADQGVQGIADRVTELVETLIVRELGTEAGVTGTVRTWSTAIVGAVQVTADAWLDEPDRRPRAEVVADLSDLLWGGLGALPA